MHTLIDEKNSISYDSKDLFENFPDLQESVPRFDLLLPTGYKLIQFISIFILWQLLWLVISVDICSGYYM